MIFPIFHIPSKFEAETSVSASTLYMNISVVTKLKQQNNSLGVYIHIPFCDGKCNYCDFYSFKATENEMKNYIELLNDNIRRWAEKYKDKIVDTIYFGGGTPSVLGTESLVCVLKTVLSSFKIASDCEITLEANPSSARSVCFSKLKSAGFNRVSLGMQSSDDTELNILGRRHKRDDVIKTIELIRKNGIENISLDVMLGIPNQTTDSLIETLDFCISQDVPHISTYLLTVEPDTVFGKESYKYNFADDDMQAEFYQLTSKYLKEKGYLHYEISNFCKNDMYSRHNMRYWQLKDYLGLGPSAHSLIDGTRFYYPRSIEDFKNNNILYDGVGGTEEEYIMLTLRTHQGINVKDYKEHFGKTPDNKFWNKVKIFTKHGYMKNDDNSIRLTEKGFLMSNAIIAELI